MIESRIMPLAYFITWTTYGTWLPGDSRGWRKWKEGQQQPRPALEEWCRKRMNEPPITLRPFQRDKVEAVIREHASLRSWFIHAVSARSNHVHIAVTSECAPDKVRDQFKANATRVLRTDPGAVQQRRIWTRGGDIDLIDNEDDLETVILYITEAQDRMDRNSQRFGTSHRPDQR